MAPPSARRRRTSATVTVLVLAVALVLGLAAAGRATTLDADGRGGAAVAIAADAGGTRRVEVLALRRGLLDPPVARQVTEILDLAAAEGSALVVLQLSAPGAVSVDAAALADAVAASSVPVAVLAGPLGTRAELAGGAGLVWLAAGVRAVTPDATVGPLAPLDLADDAAPVDAAVAERFASDVDPTLLASLTTGAVAADALERAGAATMTSGLEPLLVELDGRTVRAGGADVTLALPADALSVRFHSLGLVRRVLHAATTGPFVYLLLVFGLGLLLFELFQPGFGVAGLAGIITLAVGAFGLTVLPVTWWAVALVVLGLLLHALDTSIAGLGPVTLAGTAAFAVGSWRFYAADALALDPWLVSGATVAAVVFFVIVMTTVLRAQAGPEEVAVEGLVGRSGTVRSVLDPEGHVFVDGALWRARWTGEAERARVGTPVRVVGVDGAVVLVGPFVVAGAQGAADGPGEAGGA